MLNFSSGQRTPLCQVTLSLGSSFFSECFQRSPKPHLHGSGTYHPGPPNQGHDTRNLWHQKRKVHLVSMLQPCLTEVVSSPDHVQVQAARCLNNYHAGFSAHQSQNVTHDLVQIRILMGFQTFPNKQSLDSPSVLGTLDHMCRMMLLLVSYHLCLRELRASAQDVRGRRVRIPILPSGRAALTKRH